MDIARLLAGRTATDIVSCDCGMSVREAVQLLAEKRIGALPILDNGKLAGIFSERDMIYCLGSGARGEACLDSPVGEVMTSPPITVDSRTDILEALSLMTRRRIRHLPVVEGERLVGFVSIGDLVKARLDEIQYEANAMRAYIQTA